MKKLHETEMRNINAGFDGKDLFKLAGGIIIIQNIFAAIEEGAKLAIRVRVIRSINNLFAGLFAPAQVIPTESLVLVPVGQLLHIQNNTPARNFI